MNSLELERYQDPTYGMVCNRRYPEPFTWDNPALFSAHALNLMLADDFDGLPTSRQVTQWENFVADCIMSWARWPGGSGGPPSQDELIGWAILCPGSVPHFLPLIPFKVRRFLDLVPFVKMVRKIKINIFEQIAWALWTWHDSVVLPDSALDWISKYLGFLKRRETSGHLLKYAQIQHVVGQYKITDWAVSHWQKKMSAVYTGGPKELFTIYLGAEHPITMAAPMSFGKALANEVSK